MGLLGGSSGVVDPEARDKYLLQVTAGPTYDPNTHSQVSVNSPDVHKVENDLATSYLRVRIKDYHGLPKDTPKNCTYFNHPLHVSDRYSIAWSFIPRRDISGTELVMGFDFNHPVRDRLPPGTKTAVKIATTVLDPGLYADPFSDEPYLYGPMLSSCFTLRVGGKIEEQSADEQLKQLDSENDGVIEEGAALSGETVRSKQSVPSAWKARRKFFLDQKELEMFTFEKGRLYHADFFNPHLDFSNFSLRLPGFSISVAKYVDEKTHHLRFVLKSRESGEVAFVVFFKLLFGKELKDTMDGQQEQIESDESHIRRMGERVEQHENAQTQEPRYKSIQREILGGSRAPSFQEPSGFKAPQSFTRDGGTDSTLGSAANTLAQSITAAFGAMGFGNTSGSDNDSCETSPPTIHARPMDELDNDAIEERLRDQQASSGQSG